MSRLDDLKKAAADKLATVHQDVVNYVSALESKVQANKTTWYTIGAAVCLVAILLIVHHLKHG